jgi:hypothetical protein
MPISLFIKFYFYNIFFHNKSVAQISIKRFKNTTNKLPPRVFSIRLNRPGSRTTDYDAFFPTTPHLLHLNTKNNHLAQFKPRFLYPSSAASLHCASGSGFRTTSGLFHLTLPESRETPLPIRQWYLRPYPRVSATLLANPGWSQLARDTGSNWPPGAACCRIRFLAAASA